MKNLVIKFPTNKMERNDTSWEYNNEIPFKFKLFMYFFEEFKKKFSKSFFHFIFKNFPSSINSDI